MVEAHASLVHLLRDRAVTHAHRPALTFLRDGERDAVTWTYAELDARSRAVAASLQDKVRPGERVLLLYPQGLDYVACLFGCMYAGVLAVPLQPPGKHRAKHALPKLEAIVADGGVAMACTVGPMLAEMQALVGQSQALANLDWLASDTVDAALAATWDDPGVKASDLAYLQYTSGSTSTPKGVMVSHANLLLNLRTFDVDYGHDADSVMVSWLPTFHDLGLVYGVFMPLYGGFHGVLLDPLDFLRRPLRWIEAIHHWRGTHSAAPNFAFDLAAARSTPQERARLDLTCWKVALNGAEPIRYETEAAFVEAFGPAGVTWRTMSHAYGMSESTAVIAKEPVGTEPVFLDVDGAQLERHRAVPVAPDAPGARRVAGCGVTVAPTTVCIADPETRATCPDGLVGEIWVGGPTRAEGYWHQAEATQEGFFATTSDTGAGPYLRTGDLGFVWQGQVYVTGRLKDMVIIRGENHYPQDLEWTTQNAHPGIRPSCVAAFSVDHGGREALALVAEVYPDRVTPPDEALAAVREAVADHGVQAQVIVFIAPRTIFKTSSGKIMRRQTRQALLDGTLHEVARWEAPRMVADDVPDAVDLRQQLAEVPPTAREDLLVQHILGIAARMLGFDVASALDPDAPLRELGFDSVQAVELAEELSHDIGQDLGSTALFDHPSAGELARHLLRAERAITAAAPEPEDLEGAEDDELAALLAAELEDL